MITVPEEFELGGLTWTVTAVKDLLEDTDKYGDCDFEKDRIRLDADLNGWKRVQAFLHEYLHAAIMTTGNEELALDEQHVDMLAQLLTQLLKSKKGNIYGNPNKLKDTD